MASKRGTRLYYVSRTPSDQQSDEQNLYTNFIQSIVRGDEVAFNGLIDQIIDVNANPFSNNRWTPIMHAAHKDRLQFVNKLLERGADAQVIDTKTNRTLLHNAAGIYIHIMHDTVYCL